MDEESLFHQALSLQGAAQREVFLDQECAGRPGLRAAVEALLAAYADRFNPLDQPPIFLAQMRDRHPGDGRQEN